MLGVLEDWTRIVAGRLTPFNSSTCPAGASIYRVFLLPGCLQFDLSFTPASRSVPLGPKFKLLFGRAARPPLPILLPPRLFGHAVHHALRAGSASNAVASGRPILDQQPARLGAPSGLPPSRTARAPTGGALTICPPRSPPASRMHSCGRWSEASCSGHWRLPSSASCGRRTRPVSSRRGLSPISAASRLPRAG